eukprot:CAMPEP_0182420842 /NCGR_PEP_ID=MMETSP1167-20130531/5916_1 /TAXON_ID=2988 /ORGANISM="Mallomonas Sp, Strain CCMP3275" /LENGTH=438 /DNA_ID=CAMNT_0024597339 /DNA_START=106 /DNA_END=1422 /DNA_ORIENTATION=+
MASLAELRQLLKQDGDGKNLYDHLTETLMKILLDKPKNAYDMFELISAEVKANPLNPDPPSSNHIPPSPEEIERQLKWAKACTKLLQTPDEPPEPNVKFPDLMDESNLWEWAGISFGKSDTYRLYLSIQKFAETVSADYERLRFFGRINTRSSPYYIIEGVTADEEDEVDPMKVEGKAGANKYTYWVSQNVDMGPWIKLPNVTAEQVVIARKFKRFLTGQLDSALNSYPPFPGVEKNLLRAQIARIAGETSISPVGYFELDEDMDPPALKLAEDETINEIFPKKPDELKDMDAWNHHEIELNKLGRATVLPEQLDDNGDPIEEEDPVEAIPPLNALTENAWTFRTCPGGAGLADFSLVVAKSLLWPGAIAITGGKRFLNLYVGNGIMYEEKLYTPPLPSIIQIEWKPEEEDDALVEQEDTKVDPTPPEAEEEEEEEED